MVGDVFSADEVLLVDDNRRNLYPGCAGRVDDKRAMTRVDEVVDDQVDAN